MFMYLYEHILRELPSLKLTWLDLFFEGFNLFRLKNKNALEEYLQHTCILVIAAAYLMRVVCTSINIMREEPFESLPVSWLKWQDEHCPM